MLIVTSLRTQYENLGDIVINSELVRRISQYNQVVCLASGVPDCYLEEMASLVGEVSIPPYYEKSTYGAALRVACAALMGKRVGIFLSPGATPNSRSGGKGKALFAISRFLPAVKFGQVGASYDVLHPETVKLLREVTANRNFMTTRDAISRSTLATAGVEVPIVPDLALGLSRRPNAGGKIFALSFRTSSSEPVDAIAGRLRPVVENARAHGFEPKLFWQVEFDREPSLALSGHLGVPVHNTGDRRPNLLAAEVFYRQAAVVCSNRLHALLIGAANGALPMAMLNPAEKKVTGCFEYVGLGPVVSKSSEEDAVLLEQILHPGDLDNLVTSAFARGRRELDGYFSRLAKL